MTEKIIKFVFKEEAYQISLLRDENWKDWNLPVSSLISE